ncbi:hypothetical protein LJR084_006931 [Variovorax sp. LjRoot84]|uniref:hypothetical protein n=1 Tax=Variovorax sp. LjRoot84 TaxID=3342340 RepID=UPI003ECC82CC
MKTINIVGWKPGFLKISFAKILQENLEISLFDAKEMVERIMKGVPISVEIQDERVESFLITAEKLGAACSLVSEFNNDAKKS